MKAIILTFIGLIPTVLFGQNLTGITPFDQALENSSGLVYLDGKYVTINNTPGDNYLYEVNPESGVVDRSVLISQSVNIDWSSLMTDGQYIYIFDIGNDGTREVLKVYYISVNDFLTQSVVQPNQIKFRYPELNEHNLEFDANAAVILNGDFYIFTEADENGLTKVYTMPSQPGTYEAEFACELKIDLSVTAATVNDQNEAVLMGTTSEFEPSIIRATLSNDIFTVTEQLTLTVPEGYSSVVDGVSADDDKGYVVSTRYNGSPDKQAGMLLLDSFGSTASIAANEITEITVTPNPADEFVSLNTEKAGVVSIYTTSGAKVWESSILPGSTRVETSQWNSGMYIVSLEGSSQPIKMMVK